MISLGLTLLLILSILIVDFYLIGKMKSTKLGHTQRINGDKLYYETLKSKFEILRNNKSNINSKEYSYHLLHLKRLIIDNEQLTAHSSINFFKLNRVIAIDIIIAALIFSYPFLYNAYSIIPVGVNEYKWLGLTFGSNGFVDVSTFCWFLMAKLGLIILMSIWFYTSKNWWRFAILSPIILYTYQLWEATQDVQHLDAYGNLKAFPAIFTIVIFLVLLSNVFKYKYRLLDIHDRILQELEINIEKAARKGIDSLESFGMRGNNSVLYDTDSSNSHTFLKELNQLKEKIKIELKSLS